METKGIKSVSLYSNILMLLTSIHHVYGAVIYNTPWRLHVLIVSIPVILITLFMGRFLIREKGKKHPFIFGIYWLVILIPSICLIGLFEGVYNHLLKDILFYAGVNNGLLLQMFPPPKYELPNDFWFEFTGIMQAVVVGVLIVSFIKLTTSVWKAKSN